MLALHSSPFDLFERLDQQLLNAERVPSAEVHDSDDAYEIVMELPGVDRSSIDVKATDQTLMITAERQSHRQPPAALDATASDSQHQEGESTTAASAQKSERAPLMSEFRYGTWSRKFRFPSGINREGLEAHYRNGLLSVRAPKTQTITSVSVKVEA